MKVCLLNDSFPPVIDGVVNVMMNYADYLMKDHASQVIVGTPSYPDTDYTAYPYKVVPYHSFATASVTNGYRTGNPFVTKAVRELGSFRPDIIHSHCPASATVVARLLREETGAPIVFTYHTNYDIDIRRAVRLESIAREGIRMMVGNIEACDEIWVVSRGAGESLKALGFEGDYRVMSNGVDFARGRVDDAEVKKVTAGYDLPEGVPVYLYVGRLMNYKGLPLILEALKMRKDQGQDFRMVFVGKGPDREKLEEQAASLGLMDEGTGARCFFTGPIYDRDALRAWNTRADLFLFPSTFDTNGLVVREAAACGLASVLIRDSCAAEGITDGRNGFIIDETPESLAALLEKTSSQLDYVHQVGRNAMKEIYRSWQDSVSEAYDRYQVILEEKAAGRFAGRKKLATDYLVSVTAKGMEEQEKIMKAGREMFSDFRHTAAGMMENILEAEENAGQKLDHLKEEFHRQRSELKKEIQKGIREEVNRWI